MTEVLRSPAELDPERRALLDLLLAEEAAAPDLAPLSLSQQRLWLADRMDPGNPVFNIPSSVRLSGRLDLAAFHAALNAVVERHESLRTTFGVDRGEAVQVIAPAAAVGLPLVDLSGLPATPADAAARALGAAETGRRFDLETGPLLRVVLVRLAAAEHVVLVTLHHIIADGWSMAVLIRELGTLYDAFSQGRPSPLPELPIQYADFAEWQRGALTGAALERQLAFWREHLAGAPTLLDLPTDRPRPAVRSFRGGSVRLLLEERLSAEVKALAQHEGVTPFMAMLAAAHALLGRWTGQEDLLVGSPVAGRNRVETEGVIGFFVNNLVFRARLQGDPTGRELMARAKEEALDVFGHQDVPFDRLVEEVQAERDLASTPLYQVQLMVPRARTVLGGDSQDSREPREPDIALPGLTLQPLGGGETLSQFDLSLTVVDRGWRFAASLVYNRELFDPATALRLLGHFEVLLAGLTDDPDRRLSALPVLTPAERHALACEWNDTRVEEAEPLLHELVSAHAAARPGATAVLCGGERLTYAELEARANKVANYLRAFGVGPEVVVGLCVDRSPELVVGLLGILKAGAAYLPLDPTYPLERLAYMLEDSRVMILLAQERVLEALPAHQVYAVTLDAGWDAIERESPEPPAAGVARGNLAYVIYTSGSTGRPKGVQVTHGGLANLCAEQARIFAVGPASRVLQFASLSFDASISEIAMALCAGAALCLAGRDELLPGPGLVRLLAGLGVTTVTLPPSALAALPSAAANELPDLATLVVAGEACPPELADRWAAGRRLVNAYGPTEATVCATAEPYVLGRGALPLGRPIGGVIVHVLGRWLEPVPAGVPGELMIGGLGLARGYLDRPDLTAERFLPDPVSASPGARLYRSGDLARRLPDGRLDFLGRIDHQVKVRGFRIELGEIEAALLALPGVREAVVAARGDGGPGGDRLVAYLVAEPERELPADDLRRALKERLPEHMVPAAFVPLAALPLTPNGKVDRRALPAPEAAGGERAGELFAAPRDPIEELLAGIWAGVLGIDADAGVGIHDSFFDLGGHSLLATQLLSRVRDALGVEMPLRKVFEAPTIAGFARQVEAARREERGVESGPIPRVPRGGDLPLSFAQERLWFLDQLEPGSPTYNIPSAVRLAGPLDPGALAGALAALAARHESLRTTFPTVAGRPVQAVAMPEVNRPSIALPVLDLAALPGPAREREARRVAAAEAVRPFDLAAGPLVRAVLVALAPEQHALLLAMHHIVSDGWSIGVFVRELATLHRALVAGEPSPLPELPIQYADFAAWQRDWLAGEVLERQLDHWRRHLAGAPSLLELPTDRPRPPVQSFRGSSVAQTSAAGIAEGLSALGRREGVTLFMTLLAAWGVLLRRYTGREDLVVGSPIANRNRAELEGLIGFFVNTLVLRTRIDPRARFRDLLRHVREATLEAYAHQDLPFEKLVEALQPERNLAYSPLFQVMLVLQNNPDRPVELPGLTLAPMAMSAETSKYDLTLNAIEAGPALACRLVYSAALFDAPTVARMLRQLHTLLESALADPDRPVEELELLPEGERLRLLYEWNEPRVDYPDQGFAHEMFAAQAARRGDAPAVVFAGEALGYRELDDRADRLAHRLRRLGVGPETVVGVCLERSFDLVVALLAVLKAGGAYLPLDPALPPERLGFMLADSGAPLVLTWERLADRLAGADRARLLYLSQRSADEESAELPALPEDTAWPESPAYVLYTSGSTGQPKGVVISHRALGNRLQYARATDLTERDAFLQKTTISFDVSVLEIFAPLVAGGRTVLAKPGGHQDTAYLVRLIAEQGVTQASFPPSTLAVLLDEGAFADCAELRLMVTGGETVPAELPRRFHAHLAADLYNRYGPTEATISVTSWLCEPGPVGRVLPIGRPTAKARVYLVDRSLQPAPIGVPGELLLGGLCLARGYLGRPGLTAESFIPDPFSADPGGRLYRTGDLARYRPDGAIEFVGRRDQQVKVRGFRVELGEIEAALHRHPAVREAAVVDREDLPGEKRLVAYVVPEAGASGGPEGPELARELRGFLGESLPGYMVPAAFVALDALPLSPTGKVDRRALPAPEAAPQVEGEREAPLGPVEELLAAIWVDLLGCGEAGRGDDFFDLGGHSLLATRLVSRVREAFGVELPLRAVFEEPTLAALAAAIVERKQADGRAARPQTPPPLVPVPREGALPLSFAQQRLWFLHQLEPASPAYNLPTSFLLRGALDLPALARAVGEVVRRHEALRTTFPGAGSEPAQSVSPPAPVDLPRIDLRALPEAPRGKEARRLAAAEARRAFDLAKGPLLRTSALALGAEETLLLATLHHIVGDGWSTGVLIREVAALYEAFAAGRPSPLAELPIQYADFASWQRGWLRGEALAEELAYWRERLEGAPPVLELPADRPRPAVQSGRGAVRSMALGEALLRDLAALGRAGGTTPFMTLLAAFQVLLGRYAGSEDVTVGSPVANRNRAELEPLIGFFVNTLVLRTGLAGDPSFRGLLARVREATLGAYAHQDLPFEKLVEELRPERSLAHSPLFQVMFMLQSAARQTPTMGELTLAPFAAGQTTAKFDLLLSVTETGDGAVCALEYATDLFDPATAARLLGHFEVLLAGAAAAPDLALSALPLLAPPEHQQLLAEWHGAAAEAVDARLHDAFFARAALDPGAPAVLWGAEAVTYGELATRASALAERLRALGVGPEVRVGVCLRRTPELAAALLAVLRAGGAYVPLDPAYPAERLAFMLEDSATALVLTESSVLPALPATAAKVLCLDHDLPAAGEGPAAADGGSSAGNLAYVIYTSGSTGRPKGVAIEHRSAVEMVRWAGREFSARDLAGVLASTSVCFDLSVFELFVPLSWGGAVVLADNALALPELPARTAVTLLNTVPSALAELLRLQAVPPSVRTVNLAGEPLRGALVREIEALGTVERVLNLYGPSEDTTYSTWCRVRGNEGEPTIGRPVPGTQAHVLDPGLRPVPAGVVGELCLSGRGLARGYLGRPGLTAERFVPDPHAAEPGERLYKTGDRARRLPDGRIEFLGRFDHQVKVRGFRIELGEIEAALGGHPAVREAAVLAREDAPGDRRLVAYVVPREGAAAATAEELRSHLLGKLPEHMVPSAWVALAALPLTPNGKVDRKALPAPERAAGGAEAGPRTPVEELLAGLYVEVLGEGRTGGRVGAADGFFDLGGHSLLATQLVSRAREAFGVELPLRAVFEAPTVAGLAARIEAARAEGEGLPAPPIVPVPREGELVELPASFAQERLWFVDQLQPGQPAYNLPVNVRMTGALDVPALAASLEEIVRRHEVLRTTFASSAGRAVQRIAPPPASRPLPLVDLSGLPEPVRDTALFGLATEEARRPFDLGRGPLLRTTLLRLGEAEHVALLVMHHVVSDGWSMGVFVRELVALWEAFAAGRRAPTAGQPSPLPDLAVQYADFAHWQRGWLQGEVLERQLAFWRRELAGAPALLELPADRPRPPVPSMRGGREPLVLSPELSVAVNELGRRSGTTLFMTLLAGYDALFHRYAGVDEVVVGTNVAGRTRIETEPLIGYFINNLVLRGDLAGDPAFAELLARTRERTLAAYAHQDLPFEKLVEELAPERNLSHSPIFQVQLVLQNNPESALEVPGLTFAPVPLEGGSAKFDLTLSVADRAGRLAGTMEYAKDLFDGATVARMLRHLGTLLAGAAAAPARRLSELPLLEEAERRQVLEEWSAGEPAGGDLPLVPPLLPELVALQAARRPEAPALLCGGEVTTYAELDARTNQLARHLKMFGVGPEVTVGLCAERSPELVVGLLGILKAGGAYVPLDPGYPLERLAFLLEDSRVSILLTQERLLEVLPAQSAFVLALDAGWDMIGLESPEPLEPAALPEGLAYVIYTSGSTGKPKGVEVTHRGLANLGAQQARAFGVEPGGRVLQFASLSFDASISEVAMALAAGAALVLAPREELMPGPGLVEMLRDAAVTTATLPPSALAVLPAGAESDLPDLATVVVAGEACRIDLAARWAAGRRLINAYGPTEATVCATLGAYEGDGRLPIGRPMAGTRVHLLDGGMGPVPAGVAGELWIGGVGLARGYHERPDLTAERFAPDPLGTEPGGRLYKSGDLARFLADGRIEFLGRADQQVKVRGFRIEPGEVEAALAAHPGVREAAVVAQGEGEGRLVAYVVPRDEPVADEDLRSHLREKLPDYMVPSAWVTLDALPLTPSGKVDRKALPAPERREGAAVAQVAPRTPVEELLAGLYVEVLGEGLTGGRVGATDSFFDLGGHSLLATQLVSRVREAFGVEVALPALFEAPTVAGLASRIEAARAEGEGLPAPPIVPVPREGELGALPASFAQERLWFVDQLQPGQSAYNLPTNVRMTGALDVPALAASLEEIVRRHEVLRTTFASAAGRAVQVIAPTPALGSRPLPLVDLSGLPEAPRTAAAGRLAVESALRPFDLGRGPLLRTTLLRLGAEEHVALLAMHHVVSDGWSFGVFVRELVALWQAFAAGRPSPLPELGIQYADFAHWQRRWLDGEVLERQLAFWRGELAGAPALLELPADRPRPPAPTMRGGREPLLLAPELSQAVRELGRRSGATLFMTLLAGYQALLHRYSGAGAGDVVVGTNVAGRDRIETEPMIGYFINNLVLRGDLSGDPAFAELLARTRGRTLAAYAHQDLPFEKLVEELAPERNLSHSPIFQVQLVLQNNLGTRLEVPGLVFSAVPFEAGVAKFDLTLSVIDAPERLLGTMEYSKDLFDGATVARMLRHLTALLAGAAAAPEQALSELPLLAPAEREQLLAEWSAGGPAAEALPLVPERVALWAALRPDEPAVVVAGGEALSWAELEARTNQLARHLKMFGVGPEVAVGLCAERSAEMVVGLLGIWKAGGAYVPLDPGYPLERLAFLLDDSRVSILLTQEHLLEVLPAQSAFVLALDSGWDLIATESAEPLPGSPALPESLAYVIYTSGSTGKPKGVEVAHGGLANLAAQQARAFGVEAGGRVLQFASLSFDASVSEVAMALAAGAALVLAPREALLPGPGLVELLRAARVTTLTLPPSALAALPAGAESALPDLATLVVAGEACRPDLAARWAAGRRLVNAYGPTEATVCATMGEYRGDGRLPIGTPMAGARVYLLDARLEPVPAGVAGELWIGGVGLARGYHERPELTAERFVPDPLPDPFAAEPGGRLYRSGDLARFLADGRIEFLGRADQQVKVRGFRIEPGEVEAALASHPGVREAAVVADGEGRLVAYVVPRDEPVPEDDLRAHLRERLPDYMVPAAWMALAALPLSPAGKVDRKALPAPTRQEGAPGEWVAPRTPVEELLAGLFVEVLGEGPTGGRVGAADSFFDLGGHSLLATQLVSRLRESFGVEVPLPALFEAPTVAGLAARIEAAQAEGEGLPAPPIVPVPRDGELPASFAQERLWFLEELLPGRSAYNLPTSVRLTGKLDRAALAASLEEIVRRHEALRTTFPNAGGSPVQAIAPPPPPGSRPLPLVDLSGLPEALRTAAAGRLAVESARRPFDLGRGPLLRTTLLKLGAEEHVALFCLHHIVADGWSMGVLVRELVALWEAFAAGRPSPLPDLDVQYADFAHWQRGWLRGEVLERQLAYWRETLAGAPALLELPTDRPRPAVQSLRGGREAVALSPELTARLHELGRRSGATLFMTLLAGFSALLERWSGRDDLVLSTPIAGRNRRETEPLIGLFLNTLALRGDLSGAPAGGELLARVRAATLGAYAHQDLPFEKLVEELAPERNLSHAPLFQVQMALQNAPSSALEVPDLVFAPVPVEGASTPFDLTLSLTESGDRLAGSMQFSRDLFDSSTVARMLGHFTLLLAGLAEEPDRPVADLPLLAAAERDEIAGWNATATELPEPLSTPERIAARAASSPRRVALVCGDARLTYGKLERRANHLAHRLRELGVGPDSRVGIALERTGDLLVGLLAVWKAGGAYVPIDPSYPAERLAMMLEDAFAGDPAPVLLTEERLLPALPPRSAGTRVVMPEASGWTEESAAPPAPAAGPGHLAYVIFTSGSTGKPKGVEVTHEALANFLAAMARRPGLGDRDVLVAVTSLSFDIAGLELWLPLATGARLVLASRDDAADGARLKALLDASKATVLQATPTTWRMLLEAGWQGGAGFAALCGGEAMPPALAARLRERVGALWNVYGPTETTIWSTVADLSQTGAAGGDGGTVPIGGPIDNTAVRVVDGRGHETPLGVPGELLIGGLGLARGYLGRPDLTADRFVPDPFAAAPGARLYRTGDLARWRADGSLECLGRLDHQVKLRGFRIELGEIEAVLGRHPAVAQAVVVARGAGEGRRLVGYVVPAQPGAAVDGGELRAFLRRALPEHMVPAALVELAALPLTPNGKVDRKALPEPEAAALGGAPYVAPRTPLELALAGLWAEILGLDPVRIGAEDNFFDLGGHSLLATRFVARAREALGLDLPLRTLFERPTLAALARELSGESAAEPALPSCLVPIQPGLGERPPLFLVHPVGGTAYFYRALARWLGEEQPVFGIQAPGMEGEMAPISRMEDMAAHYVEALRAVRPHGPYLLGGTSMGGLIAYEMARQLRAAGEEVPVLALVDTSGPAQNGQRMETTDVTLSVVFMLSHGKFSVDPETLAGLDAGQQIEAVWRKAEAEGVLPPDLSREQLERYYRVVEANSRAASDYQPGPYPGRLVFFRAQRRAPGMPVYPELPWIELATGGVEVHVVPGTHLSINNPPDVGRVGELLRVAIERELKLLRPATEGSG